MAITLRVEKAGRPPRTLIIFAFFFALCALVMIVKTGIDAYRENKQAKWPSAIATIARVTVQKIPTGSHGEWYIESAVRYSVDGEELTSSTRSHGGALWEESSMRRWASRHPPGTPLAIRYDPQHHDNVVPEAGDMPESGPQAPDDLKAVLLFSALTVTLAIIGRILRRRQGVGLP
ncbi:MAG: DUF3592 domain-containing protein [Candidatus Acidiferrales bacterium]